MIGVQGKTLTTLCQTKDQGVLRNKEGNMSTARKRAKAKRRSKLVKKGAYSGDNVRIGNLRNTEKQYVMC